MRKQKHANILNLASLVNCVNFPLELLCHLRKPFNASLKTSHPLSIESIFCDSIRCISCYRKQDNAQEMPVPVILSFILCLQNMTIKKVGVNMEFLPLIDLNF